MLKRSGKKILCIVYYKKSASFIRAVILRFIYTLLTLIFSIAFIIKMGYY